MAYEPYSQNIKRYARTFDVIDPVAFIAPFFFMKASTTGVAGDAVIYSTAEDTVDIATSGALKYQLAGYLMQDIKDLDAGPLKGWRNPNNSVEHLGGNVGVYQGGGTVFTKRYNGTPAFKDRLCVNTSDGRLTVFTSLMAGDVLGTVESVAGAATPTVEPTQYTGTAGPDFIRVRLTAL